MAAPSRTDLIDWLQDTLRQMGGSGQIQLIARKLWKLHGSKMSEDDDLFYTWQYDMRWAAQKLRDRGLLDNSETAELPRGVWALKG